MAQLKQAANTEDNNETSGFSVIPEGSYIAHITKSEWKTTRAGDGEYINLHLVILEGEYAGRMLFENLNMVNPNKIAEDIARKTLNSICAACKLQNVEDTEELHGIPMEVKVKIRPAQGDYPASNSIAAFLPAEKDDEELPWDKD